MQKSRLKKNIPENNIHHVHIWQTNDQGFLFEGHVDIKQDMNLSKVEKIRSDINSILSNEFGINHTTIQIEYNCYKDKEIIKNRQRVIN